MKFQLILFYIILLVLTGCDKQKKTARQISGTWNLESYKKTNEEGLSDFSYETGSMTFDRCKGETSCTYSESINFVFPDTIGSHQYHGTFEVVEKGDFMNLTVMDNSNTVLDTFEYRILVRTKDDLSLEYNDGKGSVHNFIFKKK